MNRRGHDRGPFLAHQPTQDHHSDGSRTHGKTGLVYGLFEELAVVTPGTEERLDAGLGIVRHEFVPARGGHTLQVLGVGDGRKGDRER